MNVTTTGGYDAAQARREDDDLDRWRFAREIAEVVEATPPDWSVRIGIFGKWGEGKSTVLRFADQMLTASENIVFAFNPWAIRDWNDLWEEFGNRLLEALSSANIPFDSSWKKSLKDSGRWLESKGVGSVAEMAAALFGREKAYNAAFGTLSRWLRYDGAQIRAIRNKLQKRRLVVLVDDLDRCAPELIPQLLLSLRELLDLPGFTFLLAFDDEIVAQALTHENPAWVEGSNFLEKILDFRFHLPVITEGQKARFISKAIEKYCPFVPQESTDQIRDLLPNNPRKLKALVRSLAALQPQVARHDSDELNWTDMWLAQMLRLESYSFFEKLLRGRTLDQEVGALYQLFGERSRNKLQEKEVDKNKGLRLLIQQSGVKSPVVIERLLHLIEAARSRSTARFRYMCELAIRPHAVTWKEFRHLFATWGADRRLSILSGWITEHAAARGVGAEDVDHELFEAMIMRRNECLAGAADSASIEEHDSFTGEAETVLLMLEQYLEIGVLDAPRFRKLYGQVSQWIGFRKNPTDRALRGQEEALLLKMVGSASSDLSAELLEIVRPDSPHPDLAEASAERDALRAKCLDVIGPKAAREAIAFMGRENGIRTITEPTRFLGIKYCLLNPESPLWKTDIRHEFVILISRGKEELTIYINARDYFFILAEGLERGIDWVSRVDIASLLSDHAFVKCLWQTVTSRGIQYRMQIKFIRCREWFIHNGVPEEVMPLTEELQLRLKEEKQRLSGSSSGATARAVTPEDSAGGPNPD